MNRLSRLAAARPRTVIAAWLLVLVAALPFGLQLGDALKAGGFSDPRGESAQAQQTLERAFDEAANALLVVLHDPGGDVTGAVATAREAADRDGVSAITDHRDEPAWLSQDSRTTFLVVGFTSDNTTVQNLVPALTEDVRAAVGENAEVHVTGAPALDYALNIHSKDDATRAELIAFPVLFVVLLLVFRSVAAMAVPLVMAGVTLGITQAIGYGFTRLTDVNSLFVNIVTMVGLAVAVDYSLFVVKRFREELATGRPVPEALDRSMRTAGHSVLFGGLAVVVALAALFIPRAMSFTSIALGGTAVTVVAVLMALSLLPAVLTLLGHRIGWGAVPLDRVTARLRPHSRRGASAPRAGRLPVAARRPAVVLAALTAGFALLAFPATQLTLHVPAASADILPEGDSARTGAELVADEIGSRDVFPVTAVLSAPAENAGQLLQAVAEFADRAAAADHVDEVRAVTGLGIADSDLPSVLDGTADSPAPEVTDALWATDGDRVVSRVAVLTDADPDSAAAHHLVEELREPLGSSAEGVQIQLAGATATGADFDRLVLDSAPMVVIWVAALSLLILSIAFRTLLLPVLALVFNLMVVAASLGVLALISTDAENTVNSVTPLVLFAVMFGLSMDYMVIMFSRMREMYADGATHRDAVLGGLARTAGMINGAAAIMIAVFISFTSAEISIVRELGISLAVAVLLDAVVVRRLVMPAALLLIGERTWGAARRGDAVAPRPGDGDGPTDRITTQAAAGEPLPGEDTDAHDRALVR
ncbi:MMPL family transporter [Streptomyces spiramenti]|uniref:MMPL family transporter n=1 Tax=Streptomyces spiramenti TaxID=2720606 RepID=A0ABX1AT26_9ACTN|nr:MMPL family transporter [Streptomyces spiramenti]NJP68751.1 MMPL family transporter [Streptomyces spiramenti]